MALVIRYFVQELFELWKHKDTRTEHLPFTSPLSLTLIIGSYAYFIGKLGPKFMENRKPFALNNVIMIYNLIQTFLNASLLYHAVSGIYWYKPTFNFACQPSDLGMSDNGIREAMDGYYYYILKLLDLIDTVFFVLRKKHNQITFLHVYHHIGIVFGSYLILLWSPGGHFIIFGVFNCFVHTFMYLYYFASVYKPELKKNIEIKKIVTKMQIIQFGFLIYFFGRPLLTQSCTLPKILLLAAVTQNVFMILLFSDFYYKNYYKKSEA